MAKKDKTLKNQSKKRQNILKNQSELPNYQERKNEKIVFSFYQHDSNQGQKIEDWIKANLITDLFDKLCHYSNKNISDAIIETSGKKFKVYGDFPKKTDFYHPSHIPEDAKWASMHIRDEPCLIGHILGNIFMLFFST